MKTGIFSGSFDPIHNGHIMLAQYIADNTGLNELQLLVSRRNPLKSHIIASDMQRLEMARLATAGINNISVSDFELNLPSPSYTVNTLELLGKSAPQNEFTLIIGSDNWKIFDKWREYEKILREFEIIIFPRPGYELTQEDLARFDNIQPKGITYLSNAPLSPVSSTMIRDNLKKHKSTNHLLPSGVCKYINDNKLYQ